MWRDLLRLSLSRKLGFASGNPIASRRAHHNAAASRRLRLNLKTASLRLGAALQMRGGIRGQSDQPIGGW